ncbi:MAG: hypothetical protein CMO97_02630 [Woeseia sp.]|nr:hypothetical protein [Woeseia sp.]|tara:strand:+ start:3928 stop:4293 length:366 start_codon:yes stop_codon:yes gene_type:complete
MINIKRIIISFILILLSYPAFSCDYPTPPNNLPDGATSNKDQMLSGVKRIASYQEEMSSYLACIEENEIETMKNLTDLNENEKNIRKELFNKKYNAAIESQIRTVEMFNVEIREFKAKLKE